MPTGRLAGPCGSAPRRPTERRALARVVRNLPLRWKILVPFALLAAVYAGSGTYVFSTASRAEARANLNNRLRDAAAAATQGLQSRAVLLAGSARVIARTEGITEAVARRDEAALRAIVLPLVVNFGHGLAVVTDASGVSLLQARLRPGREPELTRADWSAVPLVRDVLAGPRENLGELQGALVTDAGASYLAFAAPVGGGPGPAPSGVVLVADPLSGIVDGLRAVLRAEVSLLDTSGRRLAGVPVPGRPPRSGGLQVSRRLGGRRVESLYVPVTIAGRPQGSLVVSLPAPSGLRALGDQAPKIAFLAVASLAGVFLVGAGVARTVSEPLRRLLEASRALRAGNLSARVGIEGSDEVGELASSFDAMARELEASHAELEQRVEQRTNQLRRALRRLDRTNAELARANQAKSHFLAAMSHELRTPLSVIRMASQLLAQGRGLAPGTVRDLGAKIDRQATYLAALIDDLLDLSRIEAGRLELHPELVALETLLADVDATIRPLAAEKGIRLSVADADGLAVVADPVRLRQVLVNLLSNAVKFTEPGGRVDVRARAERGGVAIDVRDTGRGIEARDLARIFEPFEQGGTGPRQGAGLGLAISKRLVDLHGGSLEVSSRPGRGTTFTVRLPREGP